MKYLINILSYFNIFKTSEINLSTLKFFDCIRQISIQMIIAYVFLFGAFIYVFIDTIKYIIKGWLNYNGAHGLVILVISFWILWSKRNYLREAKLRTNIPKGLLLTILGCLLFIFGKIGSILLVQEMSLIVTILGMVWLILGNSYLKILFLPISYLIFMFPLFEEILGNFSHYFQNVSAILASILLKLLGMTVYRHEQFIELPHITLEVAKICSGINYITALVSLSIPLSYLTNKTKLKTLALILITFIIGILANATRIALIGIWTAYNNNVSIHGPLGTLYASFIFFVVFIFLVYFFLKTADLKAIKSAPTISNKPKDRRIQINRRLNSLSIILGFLILSATGVVSSWYNPEPLYLKNKLSDIPLDIGDWKGFDVKYLNNRVDSVSSRSQIKLPDSVLKRIYKDNFGNTIKVYVSYYAIQEQNREIVSYHYDWLHDNALSLKILNSSDGDIQINKTRYRYNNNMSHAYFWYYINGKSFTNRYKVKLYTIVNAFLNFRTNGAIVIIELGKNSGEKAIEFNNSVLEFIKQFILDLKEITANEHKL